jgi:hypothetical protein
MFVSLTLGLLFVIEVLGLVAAGWCGLQIARYIDKMLKTRK